MFPLCTGAKPDPDRAARWPRPLGEEGEFIVQYWTSPAGGDTVCGWSIVVVCMLPRPRLSSAPTQEPGNEYIHVMYVSVYGFCHTPLYSLQPGHIWGQQASRYDPHTHTLKLIRTQLYTHTQVTSRTLAFAHMIWHMHTQILRLVHTLHTTPTCTLTQHTHSLCRDPMGWNTPSSLGTG